MLRSDDREVKAGLDAMIACYLILEGPAGLPLVEDLFLKNEKAEYADTYAAIMALRFHGTETQVFDKPRLVEAFRHMLRRAELADLVIPDLARWEDWESLPQLVELFQKADESSSWVRVPVINYLRVCPLPEAKRQIEELSKIDPEAVRRAETFFPFDTTGDGQSTAKQPASDDSSAKKNSAGSAAETGDAPALTQPSPADESAANPPAPETQDPILSLQAAPAAALAAAPAAAPAAERVAPPASRPGECHRRRAAGGQTGLEAKPSAAVGRTSAGGARPDVGPASGPGPASAAVSLLSPCLPGSP